MLGKSVVRHELSNQQPLITITAIPYQIRQPPVPQLPNSPCLLLQTQEFEFSPSNQISTSISTKEIHRNTTTVLLYRKLFGVRPRQLRKLLDGDPPAILQAAFVDNIRGFFAAFRHNKIWAEVIRRSFEVCKWKLTKGWNPIWRNSGLCHAGGQGRRSAQDVVLDLVLFRVSLGWCKFRKTAAHHSPPSNCWKKKENHSFSLLALPEVSRFQLGRSKKSINREREQWKGKRWDLFWARLLVNHWVREYCISLSSISINLWFTLHMQ